MAERIPRPIRYPETLPKADVIPKSQNLEMLEKKTKKTKKNLIFSKKFFPRKKRNLTERSLKSNSE